MPIGEYRPVPKPAFKRGKPSQRQRSELPPKEVKRLIERSEGVCEKCDSTMASGKAHVERRWRSERVPTSEDFIHLCTPCHTWCDSGPEGRKWLIAKQKEIRSRGNV
jgi:hypothetical protein